VFNQKATEFFRQYLYFNSHYTLLNYRSVSVTLVKAVDHRVLLLERVIGLDLVSLVILTWDLHLYITMIVETRVMQNYKEILVLMVSYWAVI